MVSLGCLEVHGRLGWRCLLDPQDERILAELTQTPSFLCCAGVCVNLSRNAVRSA
jgi:hypothetical protein